MRTVLLLCLLLLAWAQAQPVTPDPRPAEVASPVPGGQATISAPAALSLEQALSEAEANSPALREAEARVLEAVYGVDEAESAGRPRLGLSAGYQYLTPTLDFGVLPVVVNNNYDFSVSLQQTLADFGRLHWASASADLRRLSLQEDVRRTRDTLREEVRQAWAGLWFAGQARTVAQDLLAAREAHVALVQARLEAGAAARYDLVSSQAVMAEAQEGLVTARSQESVARARLLMLLGRPLDGTLELATPDDPALELPDLAQASRQAEERRPELTAVHRAVEAARARVELEDSQDNPLLAFSTRYSQRNATAFQTDSLWSAGLLFTIPLYDGGASEARTGQAEAVVIQLEQSCEKMRRMIGLEVQEAYQLLVAAREQASLARARLEQTTEALRIARLRYRTGVSVNQEVLDAEAAFGQARLGLHRAELSARQARARWQRVTAADTP